MNMDFILPGSDGSKEQPLATLYAGFSNEASYGMAVTFSDCFSAQKSNNGPLTCLKSGKYKISAAMRCRYCYFYLYVNEVQKIFLDGTNLGTPSAGIAENEIEIDLSDGDVIKATSVKMNSDDRHSICYANIFKA